MQAERPMLRLGEQRATPPGFPTQGGEAQTSPRPSPRPTSAAATTPERRGAADMPLRDLRGLLAGRGRRQTYNPNPTSRAAPERGGDAR